MREREVRKRGVCEREVCERGISEKEVCERERERDRKSVV